MSWEFVCTLGDVASGEFKRVTVDGIDLLVVGAENGISVIPPNCPHLEEPLENGMCDGAVLTCMKHLWQWEISSGKPVGLAEAPLKMYETKIVDQSVYVFIEEELIYEYGE